MINQIVLNMLTSKHNFSLEDIIEALLDLGYSEEEILEEIKKHDLPNR